MENKNKPTPQKASQYSEQNTGVTRGYNPLEIEDESETQDSDSERDLASRNDSRGNMKSAPTESGRRQNQ